MSDEFVIPDGAYDPAAEYADGSGAALVMLASCVRCGMPFFANPSLVPCVWISEDTNCPLDSQGRDVVARSPGTRRESLCLPCARLVATGRALRWPLARYDRIRLPGPNPAAVADPSPHERPGNPT